MKNYRLYRKQGKELNNKLIDFVVENLGKDHILECADFLEFPIELVFDEEIIPYVFDYIINESEINGKKVYKAYKDSKSPKNDIEKEILDTYDNTYLSLFRVVNTSPSKNLVFLKDLLGNHRNIRLTDINFSKSIRPGLLIFTRIHSFDSLHITSGMCCLFSEEHEMLLVDTYKAYMKDALKEYSKNKSTYYFFINADHDIGLRNLLML